MGNMVKDAHCCLIIKRLEETYILNLIVYDRCHIQQDTLVVKLRFDVN